MNPGPSLPLAKPTFTRTPSATDQETFHSFSRGICPECRHLVDGARIIREGKVLALVDAAPEGLRDVGNLSPFRVTSIRGFLTVLWAREQEAKAKAK